MTAFSSWLRSACLRTMSPEPLRGAGGTGLPPLLSQLRPAVAGACLREEAPSYIVAKIELGLVPACGLEARIVQHRADGGTIDVPMLGGVSRCYRQMGQRFARAGAFLSTAALPFFVGGDFNNNPASCTDLTIHEWLGSAVVAPEAGTCRSARGKWSVIDYAIVNASLAWSVQTAKVDDSWPVGPHQPVRFLLHGDIGNKVVLAFPRRVRYPTDTPFGPAPRPHSFVRADRAAWSACHDCHCPRQSRGCHSAVG